MLVYVAFYRYGKKVVAGREGIGKDRCDLYSTIQATATGIYLFMTYTRRGARGDQGGPSKAFQISLHRATTRLSKTFHHYVFTPH
jgi:hypothetical protein